MARPRPWTLIAALLLALSIVPLSGAGSSGLPAWGTEPSPNAGFPRNVFTAVDALSSTDAWAVGYYEAAGFLHPRPLVQHWNGSEWSQVEIPWNEESELLGVDAVAPDDVWMVGGNQSGGQALIAHWDGTALSVIPHPNPGGFNRLYAVSAVSADDVWAVGEFSNEISQTLVLHWDGSTWAQVPSPTGEGYNQLYGVAALATDDVWAVGEDGNSTLTLHWDGSAWTRVTAPSPGFSATLRAVSASPQGDVWAVGDSAHDPLTLRWTGTAWELVESPDPGNGFLDLNGVVALSATNAWAVGATDAPGGNWRTLTLHWNGATWSQVASPSPDPTINVLNDVAAFAGGGVVAVGYGGGTGTLALNRANGSWNPQPSENAGTGNNVLNGISAVSAQDIWAVGHAQSRSLTMHYDGSAWSVVPSPNREYGIRLEDVDAIGPFDVWAVGWSGSAGSLDDESAALHWDGQTWSIVPTPQPGGSGVDRLLAIDAVAPNDVWAVGLYTVPPLDHRSVILHWDGASWTVRPHDCDTYWGLTGITVISPTDVWAVGNATTCRYNGKYWNEVPSPQPRIENYEIAYPLEDVSAVSPTEIWAVGARVLDGPFEIDWVAFAEHWNGQEWTRVFGLPGSLLLGIEALSSNNIYAVGTDAFGPMIAHYDGTSWSTVPTPEAARGGRLAGITTAKGNPAQLSPGLGAGGLWAAGNVNPGGAGERTLIQRTPSPTQGAVVGHANVGFATISWFGPESGSTRTDAFGDYQVGGLQAGTYTFTATEPGCTPDSRSVTVIAGQTLDENFQIGCGRFRGDATASLALARLRPWRSGSSRSGS